MSYYDDIYEIAIDNHYLISTEAAAKAGVPSIELVKLAHRGRLEHISRGLYRLSRYVPSANDPYAIAVARFGEDAYLYGESVIAMLELVPTNPEYICVAVSKRTRRSTPSNIRIYKASIDDTVTTYDNIRSQSVASAIKSARTTMMGDRLLNAAIKARDEGYLTTKAFEILKDEMKWK